jgi:hypothetical protein
MEWQLLNWVLSEHLNEARGKPRKPVPKWLLDAKAKVEGNKMAG